MNSHLSQTLKWMECVRTKLTDVSIFRTGGSTQIARFNTLNNKNLDPAAGYSTKISGLYKSLTDDIDFNVHVVGICSDTHRQVTVPLSTILGGIPAANISSVIESTLDQNILKAVKVLLFCTCCRFPRRIRNELINYSGARVFGRLEVLMSSKSLEKLSRKARYALLVMLAATETSVEYYNARMVSPCVLRRIRHNLHEVGL